MDLKQNKPIHLKCPKCGHDFSKNTNEIVEKRQALSIKSQVLKRKAAKLKEERRFNERKKVMNELEDVQLQLQALKNVNRNLSENSELQVFLIFKRLVKRELGDKKTVALLQEAEDELLYRDYDTAIQRFNRFDGA